eukprot:4785567-Amphidinium_carterae.1
MNSAKVRTNHEWNRTVKLPSITKSEDVAWAGKSVRNPYGLRWLVDSEVLGVKLWRGHDHGLGT